MDHASASPDKGYVRAHIDAGEVGGFDAGAYSFFGDMAPLDEGLGGALEDGLEAPPEELPMGAGGGADDAGGSSYYHGAGEDDLAIEDLLSTEEDEDLSLAALLRRRMMQEGGEAGPSAEASNGLGKDAAAHQQQQQQLMPPLPPQPQMLSSFGQQHQQQQTQQQPYAAAAVSAAPPQLPDAAALDAVVPAPGSRPGQPQQQQQNKASISHMQPANVMTAEELEARMLRSAEAQAAAAPASANRGTQLLSMLKGSGGAAAAAGPGDFQQQQHQQQQMHQLGMPPPGQQQMPPGPYSQGPQPPPHILQQQQQQGPGMMMGGGPPPPGHPQAQPHPGAGMHMPPPPPEVLAQMQQQQQMQQQRPPMMMPPPPHQMQPPPGGMMMGGPGPGGPGGPPPHPGMMMGPGPGGPGVGGPGGPPLPHHMMPPHGPPPGPYGFGGPVPPRGPPPMGPPPMGPPPDQQQQQRPPPPHMHMQMQGPPGQPHLPGQLMPPQGGGPLPFPSGPQVPHQQQQQQGPGGIIKQQQGMPPPGFAGGVLAGGMMQQQQQRHGSPGMHGPPPPHHHMQQQQGPPGQPGPQQQQLPPWATGSGGGPAPPPQQQQHQQQGPGSGQQQQQQPMFSRESAAAWAGEYMATATAAPADAVRVVSPAALVGRLRANGSAWMAADDINYILRIQRMSTHSGVPYMEDFYFQAFCNKYFGGRNALIFSPQQLRELMGGADLQLEEPRFADLAGLGRVVLSNIRTPKMLMDVGGGNSSSSDSADNNKAGAAGASDASKARPLEQEPMLAARIMVEDCMLLLCDVEDIDRMFAATSAAASAHASGMQLGPHTPGPLSPAYVQALLQRRAALLGGIAASFRLPDAPTLAAAAAAAAAGEAGDGVFVRILALPKGRSLITKTLKLMFSAPAPPAAGKGAAAAAAGAAADAANGGSSSSMGLDVIWALLRNAQLAFGPALVGSVGEAEKRLTDATIALASIASEMVKRLKRPEEAVACLAAAIAGLSAAPLTQAASSAHHHSDAAAAAAAAAAANGAPSACQLLPLFPAGRVPAGSSPEWLGSILGSLLLRASELGLGSFAAAAAAGPARSLGDGVPDELEVKEQQVEAGGVSAAASAEWQRLLAQFVQLVSLHLWQLVQASSQGAATEVAGAAGAGPGSTEVLLASVPKMACVPLMRVLMAHCSEEQQEQLKGYLAEVGR